MTAKLIDDFTPLSPAATVSYQQWQNIEKVEKVNIVGTVIDAFIELKKQLGYFLIHTFVKRKQAAHMDNLIVKCNALSCN